MRILTWNCNLNLKKKYELLESFEADILIIQECEQLPKNYFPNADYLWTGKNDKKGLGVITRPGQAQISSQHDPNLVYFLPVEFDDLHLLALWAFNHRAARFGNDAVGKPPLAITQYQEWLAETDRGVVGGDFNNSVIWDKPRGDNRFSDINAQLEELGFASSYHQASSEKYGQESATTLYHTKGQDKRYHIDYLYTKGLELENIEIGDYESWIAHSDHVPLMGDFKI